MKEPICPECNQECLVVPIDDSFDYSGTHCTGGQPGTHRVPIYYVSDCCEAEILDYEPDCDDGPDYEAW